MTSGGTLSPSLSPSNHLALSPDLYRVLGDLAPGFLWLVDTEGRFIYTNRPWEEFTGSNLEQLNRLGWERFNHPDELAEVRERWNQAAASGEQFEMELRYRRHDGEYRWMLARVVPIRGPAAQVQGWLGTSVDIHELKTTQNALHEQERELNEFFENAAVPIHWVGPDGTILRVNQAELDLLGYTREEYLGHNIAEFHADEQVIREILRKLLAGESLRDC